MRCLTVLMLAGVTAAASAPQAGGGPLLSYLRVGPHRVAFETDALAEAGGRVALVQSTFADVRRALGRVQLSEHGDAGDALRWVCYRLAGRPRMSLLLESDKMGGGDAVTSFELVPAGSRPDREGRCAALAVRPAAVATNTGLRLGLTRAEVAARLGVAGRDSADVVVYDRARDRVRRASDGTRQAYTEAAGFVVQCVRRRVAAVSGYRVDAS